MIKILLVSEDKNVINRFKNIFSKNSYDLEVMNDENLNCDDISLEVHHIFIIETN